MKGMDNVKRYYETARDYRKGLREAWGAYEEKHEELQGFQGTDRYRDDLAKAQDERDARIRALQDQARTGFNSILAAMRTNIANAPMTAPTAEQMAILQALQMRESVDVDELRKAGEQLKGVDVAVKALDEIGAKHGHMHAVDEFMGATARAERAVDELTRSAQQMVTLTRPDGLEARHRARHFEKWGGEFDAKHEGMNPHSPESRMSLTLVDKDFANEREAMYAFGGVKEFNEFRSIVNRDKMLTEQAQRRAGEI